jgi:malonyl CoA-acyl carrier protein transacylase
MAPTAVLFPGQGSLTPESADYARGVWPELCDQAAELIGEDPFERAHDSTRFAQPATFVASMAGWRERRDELADQTVGMAGHSLGELSALAAAGALDTFDALRLVVIRGRLMGVAETGAPGGMIAVLGIPVEEAAALGARHDLELANDNAPGQVVLSGPRAGVAAVAADAREQGIRAMELDVTGAFHSRAMQPAREPFEQAFEEIETRRPSHAVVSGLTAQLFEDIPRELSDALLAPVRWRETMAALRALGADEFVDVGPGKVLARLVKRNPATTESDALVR